MSMLKEAALSASCGNSGSADVTAAAVEPSVTSEPALTAKTAGAPVEPMSGFSQVPTGIGIIIT
eukprot:3106377-Karenia_brevis.AAC.1